MKELEKSQWFWTPFFPQNFENHGYLNGQGVSLFEPLEPGSCENLKEPS
jgi:hypothetical protein